jgi:hypothetical protein
MPKYNISKGHANEASQCKNSVQKIKKNNSILWVREGTIPTERPSFVGWSDCQLLRLEGAKWSAWRIPTGHRHPRSSPLPRICTVPSAILPQSSQLCQVAFRFCLQSRKQKQIIWVLEDRHIVFGQKLPGEKRKRETVRCRDATPSSIAPKVRGEVFSHFHAIAVKIHSSMRDWLFGYPGRILCAQSPWCRRKWGVCSWLCSSPLSPYSVSMSSDFLPRTLIYVITSRIPVALSPRFARHVMLLLCRIHREILPGQIHDSK